VPLTFFSHTCTPKKKILYKIYIKKNVRSSHSEDALQDLDITNTKVLDRKRRDLSSQTDNDEEAPRQETEQDENLPNNDKHLEKRSNSKEEALADVSELLEGSENSDDVQRRTRQLRPSIISSPWRVSSSRAVNYAPSNQNSFGSSFSGFPSATSGFLFKSNGHFYPTNQYKPSQDFAPVISTYSGNLKNKYNFQSFNGGYSGDGTAERQQEATPKYKQSSKIPSSGHSSALLPLLYSLESFEPKQKSTPSPPIESQDNYSYFHIGKGSSSSSQHAQVQQDKVKTYAFPVNNHPTTTQRAFASYNSVGGFFNNNNNNNNNNQQQQSSNQGFLPLKPINKVTPAPIYEGTKSASSYDSRYTSPAPLKVTPSAPYSQNTYLNNLNFKSIHQSPSIFNFGNERPKHEEKVIEITTKKQPFNPYPIPTSTPKYLQSYTTPNQLFDVDKFIAELRESQRKINKTHNSNIRYQYYPSSTTLKTTSTTLPDEYYYDEDEEEEVRYDNGVNLSKYKVPSDKNTKDSYSSHSISKKPNLISSNAATVDEDEYYEDYEEEEEEFQFLPPPVNKPKYTPMTETMAPRPINVTTQRPYYVSGHTFSTPRPISSTIPSIIKFPDDVFQAIRPFTSLSPKITYSNRNTKPANFDLTKSTTPSTTTTATAAPSTTTRKTKIKIATKATTRKVTSSTVKPTRTTSVSSTTSTTLKRRPYTSKSNRGTLRFKASTKRPDLTRLEIDEKLPNR
jgi:hypothetical protein